MYFIVADDHGMVREALVPFIQRVDPLAVILQASTFEESLALATQHADALTLVILDFKMPGMLGEAGVTTMRQRFPNTKIVVLSGTASRAEALSMLKNGADGFIPKSLNGASMVNALRLVLSGEPFFPSMLFQDDEPDIAATPTGGEVGANLSPLERDVIALLVQGLSNRDIAQRLTLQEVTIKKRLSSAYRKLGVSTRLQAVQVLNMVRQG
ncbi:MAG TPA: response regulator transcription factor [Patescibacteria group bacterium]|nr:response regulator transcription factor [Patescibacteria group bacterium]